MICLQPTQQHSQPNCWMSAPTADPTNMQCTHICNTLLLLNNDATDRKSSHTNNDQQLP